VPDEGVRHCAGGGRAPPKTKITYQHLFPAVHSWRFEHGAGIIQQASGDAGLSWTCSATLVEAASSVDASFQTHDHRVTRVEFQVLFAFEFKEASASFCMLS